MIDTLVIATHNPGKVPEIASLLQGYARYFKSAGELGLAEPEETGATFAANAILKAEAATAATGMPALADDSGLCVEAMNGEPGIYSARFAKTHGGFIGGMEAIEARLRAVPNRRAWFTSALALARPDQPTQVFEGLCHGDLVWPPRGANGFGYDPIFRPDGHDTTFGEMPPELKHRINHRAAAFAKLAAALA